MLGWDPQRLAALHAAARDTATAIRSAADSTSFLHDVEPALADADALLGRLAAEWEQHLLPSVAVVVGSTFADESAGVLRRWMLTASMVETTDHRPNPADALFRRMFEHPGDPSLAAAFVLRAADDPALLFDTAADPFLAQRVALAGTAALDPADAERVVLGFIDWFRRYELTHNPVDESFQHEWRPFLVALVSPWSLHFAPLHAGWSSSAVERASALEFVVRDLESLGWLLISAVHLVEQTADEVSRSAAAQSLAEMLGSYLGLLGGLAIRVRADDEAARLGIWHRLWIVAGTAAGAVAGTVSGSLLAPSAAKATVTLAERASQPFRPDPERVARDAEYAQRATLLTAAHELAESITSRWRAAGTIPSSVPGLPAPDPGAPDPLADYVQRFAAWRSELPGGTDGELSVRLTALVWSIVGPEEAGRSIADLTAR